MFKTGDIVICIDDSSYLNIIITGLKLGDIYLVIGDSDETNVPIKPIVPNKDTWSGYNPNRFIIYAGTKLEEIIYGVTEPF